MYNQPYYYLYNQEVYILYKNKLYIIFILIILMGLILVGCDNSSNTNIHNGPYTVSGVVEDNEGNRINGVTLKFSDGYGVASTENDEKWEKTGLSGQVEITPVKEGYEFNPSSIEVDGPEKNITIKVENFIEFADTTKVVEEKEKKDIEQVTDRQVVVEKGTDFEKSISENDVIISGKTEETPEGMLRKVEKKIIKDNKVIIETSNAALDQAIKNCNINEEISLSPKDANLNKIMTSGVKIKNSAMSEEFTYGLEKIIYDKDGNENTTYDQIKSNGEVSFEYTLTLNLVIDNYDLEKFTMKSKIDGKQELSISSGVAYTKKDSFEISKVYFGSIPIAGAPIVITPTVTVELGYNGSISANVSTSTSLSETIIGGVKYNSGQWKTIKDLKLGFDYQSPSLETGANFIGFAGPELTTIINGLAGPSSQISSYFELQADPQKEIWWQLYGGIRGNVGVEVELLSYDIADYEKQVINYQKLIAETNLAPQITPVDDKTVKVGEQIEFDISADDPNEDKLTYSASGELSSYFNENTKTFSWTPKESDLGDHIITFEVSDGKSTESVDVKITVVENFESQINKTIDNLISGFEQESIDKISSKLASDFEWYLDGDLVYDNKESYIQFMEDNFNSGQKIEDISYTNRVIEKHSNTKVEITGDWVENGVKSDGEYNYNQKDTFIVKKIDNEWLMTRMETVNIVKDTTYFEINIDQERSDKIGSPGEEFNIYANITNTGKEEAAQDIAVKTEDGQKHLTKTVSLNGGESSTIKLSGNVPQDAAPGKGDITVLSEDDSDSYTVTVLKESAYYKVDIDEDTTTTRIKQGEDAYITANITNYGKESGDQDLELVAYYKDNQNETEQYQRIKNNIIINSNVSKFIEFYVPENDTKDALIGDYIIKIISEDDEDQIIGTVTED